MNPSDIRKFDYFYSFVREANIKSRSVYNIDTDVDKKFEIRSFLRVNLHLHNAELFDRLVELLLNLDVVESKIVDEYSFDMQKDKIVKVWNP